MTFRLCEICRKELSFLPYVCKYCSKSFCSEHRLPEKHSCAKIEKLSENAKAIHTEDLLREIIEFEKAKEKQIRKNPLEKLKFKLKRARKED